MRLLQSKVNTKTMLRPGKPLGVPKRCGTLVSQLSPIGFGNLGSYLRAHGWNLPVWRPRPGRFVNCAFSALIYEVGLESPAEKFPVWRPRPGESPGLAPQTGKICQLCDFSSKSLPDLTICGFGSTILRIQKGHSLRNV